MIKKYHIHILQTNPQYRKEEPQNAFTFTFYYFCHKELLVGVDASKITFFKVIKLKFVLKLKIKRTNWLIADTCPKTDDHCALFGV